MISEAYSWLALTSMVAASRYSLRLVRPARDVLDAALRVFVERDAELLDQVRAVALDEPGDVFGEMLGALGDEVAEAHHHLVAHFVRAARVVVVGLGEAALGVAAAQRRVEVAGAAVLHHLLEVEVEGHVVDAGAAVADLLDRDVEVVGQLLGGALHRMAEADLADVRVLRGDRPGVDRHRVDVLQHDRVGAELRSCPRRSSRGAARCGCRA